jgi:hypothetical protein
VDTLTSYARLIDNIIRREMLIMSGELTKGDWSHIISVIQMDAMTGNKQSQKLFFKLVELQQQAEP